MTETNVAWAAGLFEGEGCIVAHRSPPRVYLGLMIQTSDLDVLERFRDALGINASIRAVRRTAPRVRDRKRMFALSISGAQAMAVAETLRPWLGVRRLEKLDEVLALVAANPPRGYRSLTEPEVLEIRRRYADGDTSLRRLAEQFGVAKSTVYATIKRDLCIGSTGGAQRQVALPVSASLHT